MQIDVVIVTYNRIEKLKNVIKAFNNQTQNPGTIVIVNNNSSDGTLEYLNNWEKEDTVYNKKVINLNKNIGGSGGFGTGIDYLVDNNSKWIWVSDDDAYPDKNAIKFASDYLDKNKDNLNNISAICGTVDTANGIDLNHRRVLNKKTFLLKEEASKLEDYELDEFEINYFTYVCSIMNVDKIKQVGSTNREFFIYYDDSDHAARLNSVGKVFCIPKIKAFHDIVSADQNSKYTWKTYYLLRNRLFFYKFNFEPRYYKIEKFLIWLRIFKKRNKSCTKLIKQVIKDFNSNKMGLSDIYKPGTDIYKI